MALLESMPSSSTKLFPSNMFNSAALEVTTVPPSFNPLVPSWEATSKSLVPSLTVTSPSILTLPLASLTIILVAGIVIKTSLVPEPKFTALLLLELAITVVLAKVVPEEVNVPKPTSNVPFVLSTIE